MASFVLVAVVVILISIFQYFSKKYKNYPPGPWGLPILGYALFVNKKQQYKTYDDLYKRYGPVVGVNFGMHYVVLVNGWKAVQESLLSDNLSYRPRYLVSPELYPGEQKGVLLSNGEDWKAQRRFTLHHFRDLGFGKRSHESVILEEAEYLVNKLLKEDGKPVDLKVPIGVSNINILWAIVGGQRRDHSDPVLKRLVALINNGMRAGTITGGLLNGFPFLRHIAPNYFGYNEIQKAFADIKTFVKDEVKDHLKTYDPNDIRDFIDIYLRELNKEDADPSFSEKQMIALIGDLFTAGTETSSNLVSFAVLFLCKYPHLQRQLQQQLDKVVGRGNQVNLDHRNSLAVVDAFLNETLRCRNPVMVAIPHLAIKDTTIQNQIIKKGSRVNINLQSVTMDASYWGDPEVFRPDRFINPDGSLRKDERLISFGKGKRACLGESLARMTTFLIFATLVHRTEISFLPGETPSDLGVTGFTQGPENFSVIIKEKK